MTKRRALLSVYYKTGIAELAERLVKLDFELVASGRTAQRLREAGLEVVSTEELTGYPAILGHRVVTLHPKVHGAILGRPGEPSDRDEMLQHGITPFDLVVVNLYPFQAAVASDATDDECIEQIDVGGPTMVRGAAKNHKYVGIVVDPDDYDRVVNELEDQGSLSNETRKELAVKAFAHTAAYDQAILEWLSGGQYKGLLGSKVQDCAYGENRWQSPAALYKTLGNTDPLAVPRFRVVDGREPSFVNWTDVDRLLQTVSHLVAVHDPLSVAVAVKHGNACGVGVAVSRQEALQKMADGDSQAIFGSIVMVNFTVTEAIAQIMAHYNTQGRRLLNGVCAPAIEEAAYPFLRRQDGQYFLAVNPELIDPADALDRAALFRDVRGGFLAEPNYTHVLDLSQADIIGPPPTDQQQQDLLTAWAVCATSNSNTTTLVADNMLLGNGAGQQDRVGTCKLAIQKARENGHNLQGAVAVTDSFFPFADGPRLLIEAGVKVIFSTTGSNRDAETQELCSAAGITLVQLPDAEARGFYGH